MIIKISLVFITLALVLPVYGMEPTNAIEWFEQTENNKRKIKLEKDTAKELKPITLIIESDLRPNDFNSFGVIPSKIAGINSDIWQGIDEQTLFHEVKSLPDLHFHAAQTFLKRILISETNPPIPTVKDNLGGKLYLIAKLDKLIKIGALEEAETIINQVVPIDHVLFKRLAKISFLTGRLGYMCKKLKEKPTLSRDLAIRVICLSRHNDWDAAALILSSAASLNLLDDNREALLIDYLDPSLVIQNRPKLNNTNFEEIDFYLSNSAKTFKPRLTDSVKYRYFVLINESDPMTKISAAEDLAVKKSINVSTLFDTYRNIKITHSNGLWRRVIAVKNLDQALQRNNEQAVGLALERLIDKMFNENLLFALAPEYYAELASISINESRKEFNDSFAIIFALSGEIPIKWMDYYSDDKYIRVAFDVLKNNTLTESVISDAISLVNPSFIKPQYTTKTTQSQQASEYEIKTNQGLLILRALRKSSKGINTKTSHLYDSLLTLIAVGQPKLAKSILVEYLIHYSKIRI